MTVWLSVALGLIQIVNYCMTKMDEAQKRQVWEAARKTEFGKVANAEIEKAKAAAATVDLDPSGLRAAGPDSTT